MKKLNKAPVLRAIKQVPKYKEYCVLASLCQLMNWLIAIFRVFIIISTFVPAFALFFTVILSIATLIEFFFNCILCSSFP